METGFGSGKSEQRYSGKPDGVAGTPREKSTDNGQQSTDFVHDNLVVPYEVESWKWKIENLFAQKNLKR